MVVSHSISMLSADGTIDYVVSDHSPCTADLKTLCTGDFFNAWVCRFCLILNFRKLMPLIVQGGISSLGLGVSLLFTEAKQRGFGLEDVVRWTSQRTAKMVHLDSMGKGTLQVGGVADIASEWLPYVQRNG